MYDDDGDDDDGDKPTQLLLKEALTSKVDEVENDSQKTEYDSQQV